MSAVDMSMIDHIPDMIGKWCGQSENRRSNEVYTMYPQYRTVTKVPSMPIWKVLRNFATTGLLIDEMWKVAQRELARILLR